VIEIDTVAGAELEVLLLLLALVEEELLQAAAARHTASDTDATAAPFLASFLINYHLVFWRKGRRVRVQAAEIDSLTWRNCAALAS